jgi:DNA-directed RNA polymerase sigma subunit (sigma70/sigma32)
MPTLTDLYRHYTAGRPGSDAHQRTIGAQFARLAPRRQRIIAARMANHTLGKIAKKEGITKGSISSVLTAAMERIRKAITGEPRYSVVRTVHREKKAPGPAHR